MEANRVKMRVFEADEPLPVRKRLQAPVKVHPPLMPLIDVMFTLMIFFLLATHMRTQEGLIASTLPEEGGNKNEAVQVPTVKIPIEVRPVGGGARYFFRMGQVAFDDIPGANRDPNGPANGIYRQLEQIREDLKLTADTGTVVIMPSGDVPWQYIVDVYNQAVRAKFTKIGFAPQ